MLGGERVRHAMILVLAGLTVIAGAWAWARSCAARPAWSSVRIATAPREVAGCREVETYLIDTTPVAGESERDTALRAVEAARRRAYAQHAEALRMPDGTRWGSRVHIYDCP